MPVNADRKIHTSEVIETRSATISRRNGFLFVHLFKKNYYTLEDAREIMKASIKLSRGEKIPVLLQYENIGEIDREARSLAAGEKACRITKAVAMLIRSSFTRIKLQFLMKTRPMPFPVRFFKSEKEAVEWLEKLT